MNDIYQTQCVNLYLFPGIQTLMSFYIVLLQFMTLRIFVQGIF
jgi:hypothetical protein